MSCLERLRGKSAHSPAPGIVLGQWAISQGTGIAKGSLTSARECGVRMPTQDTGWPPLPVVGHHSQPRAIGTHHPGCPFLTLLTTLTTTPEVLASSLSDVNRPFCSYLARMNHTPVPGTALEPHLSELAITNNPAVGLPSRNLAEGENAEKHFENPF